MAFTVTQDILTGNERIDKEHVELFAKINDFMEACGQGKGRDEIMKTVDFLERYTKTHFMFEENIQKMNKYEGFQVHKNFHEQFIKNLTEIKKELQQDGVNIAVLGKINMQIGSSLITHIKTEDVKLAKFMKEKNL